MILPGSTTPVQSRPGSNSSRKGTPYSPKLQDWSVIIRLLNVIYRTLVRSGSYFFVEMQSVYSTAPAHFTEKT